MEFKNELLYGVTVAERAPGNGAVVSLKCLFCEYVGRQDAGTAGGARKRVRSENSKYYRAPFRTDNMKNHLQSQHRDKWQEYQSLGAEEKKVFFDCITPVANTLRAHFDGENDLVFTVERDIVQVLVTDMIFDPEADGAEDEIEAALRFFTVLEGSGPESDADDDDTEYTVSIKSAGLFHLIVRFVARGASFRMAEGLASDVKEVTQMSCFVGASRERITHFVRTVCVSNLQKISNCMRRVYSFGIAFDVG